MASHENNLGSSVDNKENSEEHDEFGIEANDLATLLSRFEEATSSDDINLPKAVHKTKWNMMKAKSAGNSPAATPPATPPPTRNERIGQIRLKTFTSTPPMIIRKQNTPMRLTVVNPVSASANSISSASSLSNNSFTKISTTSVVSSQPKVHIQIANASHISSPVIVTMAGGPSLSKSVTSTSMSPFVSQPSIINIKSRPLVSLVKKSDSPQPQRHVISIPFRSDVSKECVQNSSIQSNSSGLGVKKQTFNVLRMPALDAASSLNFSPSVKQIIPKKRPSSTLPNAIEVHKKGRLDSSLNASTASLLESVLVNQSSLTSKLTSTELLSQKSVFPQPHNSTRTLSLFKKNEMSTVKDNLTSIANNIAKSETPTTRLNHQEVKLQRDEHTYCWSGPCFNNKSSQRIGLSSSVSVLSGYTSEPGGVNLDGNDPSYDSNTSSGEVVEEGEVCVDANGNDIFSKEGFSDLPNDKQHWVHFKDDDSPNRMMCFGTDKTLNRRGRKYRRRGELGNSPVREDTSDFFDKIPSHYTALSIPAKPIRKTVFESVSGMIGNQDHLALLEETIDVAEEDQEHQYNKVPAHHRIFTNTSQDIELPDQIEPTSRGVEDHKTEHARSSRRRRISSTSRHSTSSHKSHRSGSHYSCDDRSSRSRSRSPTHSERSDHSRVGERISRPLTRRRNSSQCSASSCSSSCSSNSYCSTCGASLSRSRSFSSDRSCSASSYGSRSRSRSPRRGKRRRTRSGRSSSPEYSRWRSASRSPSPFRRRRNSYRTSSRSRRHQMKERSSAERKIMEHRKQKEEEKIVAMEERRVLYVGKIPDNYTKHQLRKRFENFGEIKGVRLNFRVHGDNYGFVTFTYACDAFAAKEKGNNMSDQPKFDLCFGGRRRFCPDKYADLDGNREIEEEYAPLPSKSTEELDYAALLKQHVSQQKKRKR